MKLSMEIHGRGRPPSSSNDLRSHATGGRDTYIVLKKAIKGVITKSRSLIPTISQPSWIDWKETNEAGGRNEASRVVEEMLQDDFFLLSGCLPYIRPEFDLPIGPD